MGYTQFEKIPISKERREEIVNAQINELVDAIDEMRAEGGERFSIKQAELKKKSLLERLDAMQNIPDISTTDAKKTTDMYEKCCYLNEINNGRCGVVFSTGTPVINSMCAMYTMQRYLQPNRLGGEFWKNGYSG